MTMSPAELHIEEVALARYLAGRVCDGATGRLEDECTHNPPRDTYFIGCLRPVPPAAPGAAPQRLPDEVLNKIAPSAFGLDAKLIPKHARLEVTVTLSWACYYRVCPTRAQQTEHQGVTGAGGNGAAGGAAGANAAAAGQGAGAPASARRSRRRDDAGGLFPRYRRLQCSATGRVLLSRAAGAGTWAADARDLQRAVATEIARAQTEVGRAPDRLSDALVPSPMRSLREVDEQVSIELDSNGSAWGDLVPAWGE